MYEWKLYVDVEVQDILEKCGLLTDCYDFNAKLIFSESSFSMLIAKLEEKFCIKIPDEYKNVECFETYVKVCEMVNNLSIKRFEGKMKK